MIAVKLGLPQISTMSDLPIRMDYFSISLTILHPFLLLSSTILVFINLIRFPKPVSK